MKCIYCKENLSENQYTIECMNCQYGSRIQKTTYNNNNEISSIIIYFEFEKTVFNTTLYSYLYPYGYASIYEVLNYNIINKLFLLSKVKQEFYLNTIDCKSICNIDEKLNLLKDISISKLKTSILE